MVSVATIASVVFYLAPIAAFLAARSRRRRTAGQIALDIPFAAALDLLLVMGLARLATVETAVLLSRPLWLTGAALWAVRCRQRGDAPAWPRALTSRHLAALAVIALAAVLLSLALSRRYCIWDRHFHMPLVASIRGQTIPFSNTYDPGRPLHYHIAGDILAAVLQVGSGDVLHAGLALSLSHDVLFAMTACTAALLARELGARRFVSAALGALAILLSGPVTFSRPTGRPLEGYSFTSFLELSFRPHAGLAGLLIIGLGGAILVPLFRQGGEAARRSTFPEVLALFVLLGVSDEPSCATLGIALAAAWLVAPRVLHPRRLAGLAALAALPAAILGANALFSGSLVLGGPVQRLEWMPWRSPGFYNAPLLLSSAPGSAALLLDALPILAPLAAVILLFARARSRRLGGALAFLAVLSAVSLVLLTRLEVNRSALESHRFATAPLLIATLAGVLILPGLPLLSAGRVAALGGASLAAASTLAWMLLIAPRRCDGVDGFSQGGVSLYDVDCRADMGARLGQRPMAHYITSTSWYAYAGCVPTFAPGDGSQGWPMNQYPDVGLKALRRLHAEMLPSAGDWFAICPSSREEASRDPICPRILRAEEAVCAPSGSRFVRCRLPAAARRSLLPR